MTELYLKTKFAPPHYNRPTIRREDILARLGRELPDIIVIHAPGGYGKTTLAAQMRQDYVAGNSKVAWLNLDDEDNDPDTFITSFVHAFVEAGCDFASEALLMFKPGIKRSITSALTVFTNDLIGSHAQHYLFVDNGQLLKSEETIDFLFEFIANTGSKLKIIFITRVTANLPLHELRQAFKVSEVDTRNMQFSFPEAKVFLESRLPDSSHNSDNQRLLYEITEGWVSALDWAALAISRGSSARSVKDLLFNSEGGLVFQFPKGIMSGLDETVKTFLFQTCILDSFNVDLAQALTGMDGCSQIIADLESENFFLLPVENERNWYRYHPLFLTALRQDLLEHYIDEKNETAKALKKNANTIGKDSILYENILAKLKRPLYDLYELHRRAARWYLDNGITEQALKHYINVNDISSVTGLLENSAQALLEEGQVNTLIRWARHLPEEVFETRPRLLLCIAWAYTLTCRTEKAGRIIKILEENSDTWHSINIDEIIALKAGYYAFMDDSAAVDALSKKWQKSGDEYSVASGCNAMAFGRLMAGQYEQAREAVLWVEQKPELQTSYFPYIYRQNVLAISHALEGKFEQSNKISRAALDLAEQRHGRRCAPACVSMAVLSDGYYEQNRLLELRDLFSYRYDVINETVYPDILIRAYVSGAKTYWALGETQKSVDLLDKLYGSGEEHGHNRVMVASLAEKLRQAIADNQINRIQALMQRLESFLPPSAKFSFDTKGELVLLIRICQIRHDIFFGNLNAASELLDEIISVYALTHRRRLLSRLKLMRAVVYLKTGNYEASLEDFSDTLTIGKKCNLKRSFIDEKTWCQSLLKRFAGAAHLSQSNLDYLEGVLAHAGAVSRDETSQMQSKPREGAKKALLSPKESEVLGYLAQGLPNKRIALALAVSPETIRWHMKNIFSKLEVNTRYDAVGQAKTLGLLKQ